MGGKISKSEEEISSGRDDTKAKAHFMVTEKKLRLLRRSKAPYKEVRRQFQQRIGLALCRWSAVADTSYSLMVLEQLQNHEEFCPAQSSGGNTVGTSPERAGRSALAAKFEGEKP